jgi:hypothetical protein
MLRHLVPSAEGVLAEGKGTVLNLNWSLSLNDN